MSLDATRAVQNYIDQQHNAGAIDKTAEIGETLAQQYDGLSATDTYEDMLHAKMGPLFEAIIDEIDANAIVEGGIEVEGSNDNKIGETRQSSDGAVS